MRKVLASLKPYYYYLVGEGIKEIEVRKDMPKASDWNKEVLFYMSKDEKSFAKIPKEFEEKYRKHFGKVGMRVICDKVYKIEPIFSFYESYSGYDDSSDVSYFEDYSINNERLKKTCLTRQELYIYGKDKPLYGWHISDLKIYDKPLLLSELGVTRPPQSYMYVEEVEQ